MLEANTFRMMMMLGGIMAGALFITMVFVYPVIEMDAEQRVNYEAVMDVTLPDDHTHLTVYDSVWFSVKGLVRGNVQHY